MSTTRDRAERLAAEKYPGLMRTPSGYFRQQYTERGAYVSGFLTAKAEPVTVRREQVEDATEARLIKRGYNNRHSIPAHEFARELIETAEGFRAAGLRVEGDE